MGARILSQLSMKLHWSDAGEQHHTDQLQAMPICKVPGCWHETRTGGCHSEAQAGLFSVFQLGDFFVNLTLGAAEILTVS